MQKDRKALQKIHWWVLMGLLCLSILTFKIPYQIRDDDGYYDWRTPIYSTELAVHKKLLLKRPLPEAIPFVYLEIEISRNPLPERKKEYPYNIEVYVDNALVAYFAGGQNLNKRIPISRRLLDNKREIDVMIRLSGSPDANYNSVFIDGDSDNRTGRSYTIPPLSNHDLSVYPGVQQGEFGIRLFQDYNLIPIKARLITIAFVILIFIWLKRWLESMKPIQKSKKIRLSLFFGLYLPLFITGVVFHALFLSRYWDGCCVPTVTVDAASYDGNAWILANIENFFDWKMHLHSSPGWIMTLASIYALFGQNYLVAKIFLLILVLLNSFLLIFLGKQLFNYTTGLVASIFYLFSATSFYYSATLQYEILLTFLLLVTYLLLLGTITRQRKGIWWITVVSGALYGFLCLTKPTFVLLAFLIPIWWRVNLKDWGKNLKFALIFFLAMGVIISPWTIRNYLVFKEFFLINSGMGVAFYIGANPDATGGVIPTRSMYEEGMSPMESSRAFLEEGLKFVREYPKRYLELGLKKVKLLWEPPSDSFPFFRNFFNKFGLTPFYIIYYSLLVSSVPIIFGHHLVFNRFLLIYMFLVGYTLTHFFFVGNPRYLIPFYPFLYLIQAVGLNYLFGFAEDN